MVDKLTLFEKLDRLRIHLRYRLSLLRIWLCDHHPRRCYSCKKYVFDKDAVQVHSTIGTFETFCKPCHQEMFHPWSATDKKG
jgi:hypothetical protein